MKKVLYPITHKFFIKETLPIEQWEAFIPPDMPRIPSGEDEINSSLRPYLIPPYDPDTWSRLVRSWIYRSEPHIITQGLGKLGNNEILIPALIRVTPFYAPPVGNVLNYNNWRFHHNEDNVSPTVFSEIDRVFAIPSSALSLANEAYALYKPFNGRYMLVNERFVGKRTYDFYVRIIGESEGSSWTMWGEITFFNCVSGFHAAMTLEQQEMGLTDDAFKIFSVTFTPFNEISG